MRSDNGAGGDGDVRWTPREANCEADRLANGDTSGFDPSPRLRVIPPRRGWFILDEALELGEVVELEKKKYRPEFGGKQQVEGKRKSGKGLKTSSA